MTAACHWDTGLLRAPASVDALRSQLELEGVRTRAGAEAGACVLLVAGDPDGPPSADVERAVRQGSADGARRLLVLVTGDRDPWALLHAGAGDVLSVGAGWARAVAARLERWALVDEVVDGPLVRDELVGTSTAWRTVLRRVVEVGRFTRAPVLLTGESGTGKELVARLLHALDPGPDRGDLVLLDCTTVVPTLSGSEFFGHERGAFTGAVSARDGAFAAADGGTLLLDEVGELPAGLQAELLRVVQEGMYKRVGGGVWHRTAFRLVCATHRDLLADQASGRFRADLYHRIAGGAVHLPPLRDRRADVLPLFLHFVAELRGGPPPELTPVVARLLEERDYPGNVRDLRQLAARVHARHVGPGPVTPGDVPFEDWPREAPTRRDWFGDAARMALADAWTYADIRDAATDAALRVSLDQSGGNVQRAAAQLAVTDRTVQKYQAERRWQAPAPRRPSPGAGPRSDAPHSGHSRRSPDQTGS